ncbi:MAG TPA: VCBS repeat-containing protein, partial [bacterium]|nr:VCBS repeat-containing protein [bacterium]
MILGHRVRSGSRLWAPAVVLLPTAPALASVILHDVTEPSGIDFVHRSGATGEKQYVEVIGSGAAMLDYDGDGRLDVYVVDSAGPNRLYRNLGGLRFEDVTDAAGVGDPGCGMGAVAADVDGDGDDDLFVTNFGPNAYYRNRGDGTFREVAPGLGLDDARWSAGAAFLDYDGDARLDLYVANYVQMATPDTNVCRAHDGHRLYCPPRAYPREADALLRQRADGTFEDVTDRAGVGPEAARGLGVVALDHDRDGWPDLYVANDLDRNFLFRNRGDGTFEERGVLAGVSHSEDGMEESGMGIGVGDYDGDGRPDLFVSNYINETNTLYRNEGDGFFFDESAASGLGPTSLP